MPHDLVSALRTALDEAEKRARAAGVGVWQVDHHQCSEPPWDTCFEKPCPFAEACEAGKCEHCVIEGDDLKIYDEGGHTQEQAAHIAAWDPARVLQLIARDRALLAELARVEKLRYADERATRSWAAHLQGLRDEVKRAAEFWLDDSARPAALPDAALDLGDPR